MIVSTRRRAGFTLMEVLIVVVILGILAGISIIAVMGREKKAKKDLVRPLLAQIESACDFPRKANASKSSMKKCMFCSGACRSPICCPPE